MERKQIIEKLRNKRYTYQKIASILGVSRQRVHQILTGYKIPERETRFCKKCEKEVITERYKRVCPRCRTVLSTKIPPEWNSKGVYNSNGLSKEGFSGRDFLKELVRRRDNHTCQICGKVWKKGRSLDVHHIDEELEGVNGYSYESCKNLDRQITLCHKCHMNLAHIRKKMSDKMKNYRKNHPVNN